MRIFETVYKLSGKLDSTFSSTFGSANKNIESINKKVAELQKTNRNISTFKAIEDELNKLNAEYKDTQDDVDSFDKKLKQSQGAVNSLRTQLKGAEENFKKLESEISNTEKPTAEMKKEFKLAKNEVKILSKELKQGEKSLKQIQTEFDKASSKSEKLKDKIEAKNTRLAKLKELLKGAGISTLNLAQDSEKLTRELDKASKAQQRLNQAIKLQEEAKSRRESARGKMVSALETGLILQAPITQAVKFESAMANVKKVVDFDTPQQFKEMGKDIVELSKKIPMTADAIAQIVAAGGQGGIGKNELLKYAESAAKMGVAFDVTAEQAGETMAQWRSAFRINQTQVETLADQINYLGNTTAASAPKISEVVKRIGPLGKVGGTASGQIAALGATMVSAGIEEEVAATGIKKLMLSLVAGESATKSQKEAFKELGLDAKAMAKLMQEDAQGAILKVLTALKELPKYKQAAVMSDMFGEESIGAIAPLLTNLEGLKDNFNKVGNSALYAGSMQKEFEARSNTTENKLILLKNSLTSLGISIGTILLPSIQSLADGASWVADKVQVLSDKFPGLTKIVTLGAVATLGLGIAWGILSYVWGIVTSPFTALNALLLKHNIIISKATLLTKAQAAAQWLCNAAFNASPMGKAILIITALGVVVYNLYKHWDKVIGALKTAWEWLTKWNSTSAKTKEVKTSFTYDNRGVPTGTAKKTGGYVFDSRGVPIGRNATGTSNWIGGLTIVGERGPELLNVPGGASILSNSRSQSLMQKLAMTSDAYANNKAQGLKKVLEDLSGNAKSTDSRDTYSITVYQTITVQGGSQSDIKKIKSAVEGAERQSAINIRQEIEKIKHNERRLAFAD